MNSGIALTQARYLEKEEKCLPPPRLVESQYIISFDMPLYLFSYNDGVLFSRLDWIVGPVKNGKGSILRYIFSDCYRRLIPWNNCIKTTWISVISMLPVTRHISMSCTSAGKNHNQISVVCMGGKKVVWPFLFSHMSCFWLNLNS